MLARIFETTYDPRIVQAGEPLQRPLYIFYEYILNKFRDYF